MNSLNEVELKNINGGSISIGAVIGISALVVFAIGVIDGFVNPDKCRMEVGR